MKSVITGVAAIGLALTLPAFAQNPTKTQSPTGQFEYQGGGAAKEGSGYQGGATAQTGTAQTGPAGQHGAAAKKVKKKHP